MELQFVNKNNGAEYNIDEGSVITICKDETLDKATIVISNLTEELDIEPYDRVVLIDEKHRFENRIMDVDTFTKTVSGLNPRIYRYEITLFSPTKELEGILLPALKITKMPGITRSVWDYMQQYITEYSPLIRIGSQENFYFTRKYSLDTDSDTDFSSVFANECPEMMWNEPNLRDVLNDLAMINDHIVVLKGDKISFMDLTEVQEPTASAAGGINYVQESRSSEDYVSALKIKMVNVTNSIEEGVNNYVTKTEWYHIDSESAVLTDQGMFIRTQMPIYKIKSLKVMFHVAAMFQVVGAPNQTKGFPVWVSADLMDCTLGNSSLQTIEHQKMVVESKEYQLMEYNYQAWNIISPLDYAKYRNFMLYYTRGSNEIRGFDTAIKEGFYTNSQIIQLLVALLRGVKPSVTYTEQGATNFYELSPILHDYDGGNIGELFFSIEYETLMDCTLEASKGTVPSHTRVVQDNQSQSYINSRLQGALEYMKANRLGNLQKHINATYRAGQSEANMLKIGDIVDESVIYRCEYQIYDKHVEVNAMATKDYVLRNYYTGVRAKLRSWKIAEGSDALRRVNLVKQFFEFGFREKIDVGVSSPINLSRYLMTPLLGQYTAAPIKYCFLATRSTSGWQPVQEASKQNRFIMDLSSRIAGDSLVFACQFVDNYWAGKYVAVDASEIEQGEVGTGNTPGKVPSTETSVLVGTPGGLPTQNYSYTDENGELLSIDMSLSTDFSLTPVYTPGWNLNSIDFMSEAFALPKADVTNFENDIVFNHRLNIHKDSQEMLALSIQFELCRATENISFTDEFMKSQQAMSTIDRNTTITMYVAPKLTYNLRKPELPFTATSYGISVSFNEVGDQSVEIILTKENATEADISIIRNSAIYLTDSDNKLLMAMIPPAGNISVSGTTLTIKFYLNCIKVRDDNIYDPDNHDLIVGSI